MEEEEEEEEEEVLSQKLSQLTTNNQEEKQEDNVLVTNKKRRLSSTTSTPDVIAKKIKSTTNDTTNQLDNSNNDLEKQLTKIPYNLSQTNENFIQLVQEILSQTASSITNDDIQQIALFIYRLAVVHIHKQIIVIQFKSGTGTLRESEPELQYIKSTCLAHGNSNNFSRKTTSSTEYNSYDES